MRSLAVNKSLRRAQKWWLKMSQLATQLAITAIDDVE
jgi:hypothetical protein